MTLSRRRILFAAGAAALVTAPRVAAAASYPTRPVRIVVPTVPGGGIDFSARLIGQWLADRLGQAFVVDNRPGAGTNIGTEVVVRAAPDGYTLLLVSSSAAVNASLYKLNFVFLRDIAPIAGIFRVPNVLCVHPSVPVDTVPAFIAYAKANPGKLNMATGGRGTSSHTAGELFKQMAGVDLTHVPYRGAGLAVTDLLSGRVQVMFPTTPASAEFVRAGRLRALAVTTASRADLLPGTPTVAEFLPGYEASQWYGMGAPKGTPREIVETLNAEVNIALADPSVRERLVQAGGAVLALSPAEFGKLIAEETEKWGNVIRAARIEPE